LELLAFEKEFGVKMGSLVALSLLSSLNSNETDMNKKMGISHFAFEQ
jgi:hypothetical protein